MQTHTWRRALVTGGAGFVGSHLCEKLLEQGTEVLCLDNLLTGAPGNVAHLEHQPGFRLVRADLCDAAASVRAAPGPFDVVLHLACPASPLDYLRFPLQTLEVGSNGTRTALEIAARDSARFVLASTSEVYGDPLEHPQREDYWGNVNPVGPRSVYDEAKRFAEALTAAYRRGSGTDTAIVRLFNSYGPRMRGGDGRAVPTFLEQALSGEPLTVAGDGSQTRSLCYVEDTVAGILAVAASALPGPVNIGGTDEVTMLELARTVIALTGSRSGLKFVELPQDDPVRRRPDITQARQLLGWQPRTAWVHGLEHTIDWYATTVAA